MHTSSEEIRKQLGIWYADVKWEEAKQIHMLGGEEVKKGKNPVHGKVHKIKNSGENIFKNLPKEFKYKRDESKIPGFYARRTVKSRE